MKNKYSKLLILIINKTNEFIYNRNKMREISLKRHNQLVDRLIKTKCNNVPPCYNI